MSLNPDVERVYSFAADKYIRKDKDPLFKGEFTWDNAPDFLKKYNSNPSQKAFVEDVIRYLNMNRSEQRQYLRPNNVTETYRANYNYIRKAYPKLDARLNANPTGLTIEQILAQDRHFDRTYRNNNIMAEALATVPGATWVLDQPKWEVKHHKLTDYGWPKFTRDFTNLGTIVVGPEGVKSEGIGWGAEYTIPWTEIDMARGGAYDPDYWTVFMLSQKMGIFGDQRLALGASGQNTTDAGAPNKTGIHNWYDPFNSVSAQTVTTGSSSGGVMTHGVADFNTFAIGTKTAHLAGSLFTPDTNLWFSTPGIAAETFVNDSAVGALKTCYQQVQDKWFRSGAVKSWWVTDSLTNAAISTTTNQFLAIKAGPDTIRRGIIYPLQRKAIANKRVADDVAFMYITADVLQVYQYKAIQRNSSDITTTYKGWNENGLFMTADTVGQRVATSGIGD